MNMKKLILIIPCMLAAGILVAQDLPLDSLVAKFLQVKGQDKIANVQTQKLVGKLTFKNKQTVPFIITEKRPDLFRIEWNVQGTLVVEAGNDSIGWKVDPTTGSSDPQDMTSVEIKQDNSIYSDPYYDWDNPLLTWKKNGSKLELTGREDMKGIAVYHIRLASKDNNVVNFYIDTNKFVVLKVSYNVKAGGRTFFQEQAYSDFRSVDGILFPFRSEMFINGQKGITLVIEKCEFNSPVFDILFRKPAIRK